MKINNYGDKFLRYRRLSIWVVGLLSLFFVWHPVQAQAASINLSPSSGQYKSGQTFTVGVYVSSADQPMNAVSGTISFPVENLQVVSLSKSGSIISLWVQEPSFSNTEGKVNFEGIVLNPGFIGSSGKIISIQFKAKAGGSAALNFAAGSVLANDGKGTNILSGLGSARFSIEIPVTGPQAEESTTPVIIPAGVPPAPKVSSLTHPDPNKWYSNKNPTFTWVNSYGTNGVNVLADHNPNSDPGTHSDGLRNSYTYNNVGDGVWYFHIRLHNSHGWGGITNFRFQIDTQKPNAFAIKFIDGNKTTNPKPVVLFDTNDTTSGIDYYKVKVGDKSSAEFRPAVQLAENPYTLPAMEPGGHTILVQAFDKAGNYETNSQDFEIIPLDRPEILDYISELLPTDYFVVKGKTYPHVKVTLALSSQYIEPTAQETTSDSNGNFMVVWGKQLNSGTYQFTVSVVNDQGAKSLPTSPLTILVKERAFVRVGQVALSYLTVVVTVLSLLVTILLLIFYAAAKIKRQRKKLTQDVSHAERVMHHSFQTLRAEVIKQLKMLEKAKNVRELTQEEERIIDQLKRSLEAAEELVKKEIEDIEKDVDV